MNEVLSYKELILKQDELTKCTYKCKCGHSVVIANKRGIAECSHCRNLVFKNKKIEFEYRMKQNLIKEKTNKGRKNE